jgi:hypothetical protein
VADSPASAILYPPELSPASSTRCDYTDVEGKTIGGEDYTDVTKEIRDRLLKPNNELLGCDQTFVEDQLQVSLVSYFSKMRTMSKDDIIATDNCDQSTSAGSASLLKQLLNVTSFSPTMERLWAVQQQEKNRPARQEDAGQMAPSLPLPNNPIPTTFAQRLNANLRLGKKEPLHESDVCAWYLAQCLNVMGKQGQPYHCKHQSCPYSHDTPAGMTAEQAGAVANRLPPKLDWLKTAIHEALE